MPNVILGESGSPAPFGTPYPGATAGAAVAANIANSMANAKKAVADAKMRQALTEAAGRGELVEENGQRYETGKQPSAQRQAAPPAALQAPLAGVPMPSLEWRSGFPAGQNTADVAMRGLEEAANIRGIQQEGRVLAPGERVRPMTDLLGFDPIGVAQRIRQGQTQFVDKPVDIYERIMGPEIGALKAAQRFAGGLTESLIGDEPLEMAFPYTLWPLPERLEITPR